MNTNQPSRQKSKIEMLVDTAGEETRVAICRDGRLDELWVECSDRLSLVGNIYKGRITKVERGIQAAFVDFGADRDGFLHVNDVHRRYFPKRRRRRSTEKVGKRVRRSERPPIEDCLARGDEVAVQVVKDSYGRKGAAMTTYLSIPGRTLVMLADTDGAGVSRRVNDEDRRRLREMLSGIRLPKGTGFILRTAGSGSSKGEIQADVKFLARQWKEIQSLLETLPAPAEIHREYDIVTQVLRDRWTKDFGPVIVNDAEVAKRATAYLKTTSPRLRRKLVELREDLPVFDEYGAEADVAALSRKVVSLPSGGSIVVEPTEALVSIDVNSGRMRGQRTVEATALKANLEAADEVARQLRLRNLGGLVVVDFIDMRLPGNCRRVEAALETALDRYKEKSQVLRMSEFGIVEITRQRGRVPVASREKCPQCQGCGSIRSIKASAADAIRAIRSAAAAHPASEISVFAPQAVVTRILNERRKEIARLERSFGSSLRVFPEEGGEVRVAVRELPASKPVPGGKVRKARRRRRKGRKGRKSARAAK